MEPLSHSTINAKPGSQKKKKSENMESQSWRLN